eukprot:217949-Pelagomonas_calceolata.AAC.3
MSDHSRHRTESIGSKTTAGGCQYHLNRSLSLKEQKRTGKERPHRPLLGVCQHLVHTSARSVGEHLCPE